MRGGTNEHFRLGWNVMKNVQESEVFRSTRKMGEKYALFHRVRQSYDRLKGSVCQSLVLVDRMARSQCAANDLEWRRVG